MVGEEVADILPALAVLLELVAGVGLAVMAGPSRVQQVLTHFDWAWLPVLCACLGATRSVFRTVGPENTVACAGKGQGSGKAEGCASSEGA